MRKLLGEQSGASVIEFGFVFIPFMASLLIIIESSRLVYVTTALDLVLAESARSVSLLDESDYFDSNFKERFSEKLKSWPLINSDVRFTSNVTFCNSLLEVNEGSCKGDSKSPLAIYDVNIEMSMMVSLFKWPKNFMVERSILFVQEFNRGNKESSI
ncbi:MAG: pilus assembly protein [Acinetobacter sp.]